MFPAQPVADLDCTQNIFPVYCCACFDFGGGGTATEPRGAPGEFAARPALAVPLSLRQNPKGSAEHPHFPKGSADHPYFLTSSPPCIGSLQHLRLIKGVERSLTPARCQSSVTALTAADDICPKPRSVSTVHLSKGSVKGAGE